MIFHSLRFKNRPLRTEHPNTHASWTFWIPSIQHQNSHDFKSELQVDRQSITELIFQHIAGCKLRHTSNEGRMNLSFRIRRRERHVLTLNVSSLSAWSSISPSSISTSCNPRRNFQLQQQGKTSSLEMYNTNFFGFMKSVYWIHGFRLRLRRCTTWLLYFTRASHLTSRFDNVGRGSFDKPWTNANPKIGIDLPAVNLEKYWSCVFCRNLNASSNMLSSEWYRIGRRRAGIGTRRILSPSSGVILNSTWRLSNTLCNPIVEAVHRGASSSFHAS